MNHSFALVNQYQVLELLRFKGLKLFHNDLPFAYNHWNRAQNASGMSVDDQALVDSLAAPGEADVDCVYRICSPFRAGEPKDRRKTVTFMITEFGLSNNSFADVERDKDLFTRDDNVIVTGSNWARHRLVDWGYDEQKVKVIGHGVDSGAFNPLSAHERQMNRQALGLQDDEIVFLNIGLSTWNKGVDLLLLAFAKLKNEGRKIRLILKDQKDLYGRSVEGLIKELAAANPDLIRSETLGAISVISTNLGRSDLRMLYGVADCYVSPYRAEGFNLPVLEAIACGTPVIVTKGGATDDFCNDDVALRISGTPGTHEQPDGGYKGWFIEPDFAELVEAMDSFSAGRPGRLLGFDTGRALITQQLTWRNVALQLADLAVGFRQTDAVHMTQEAVRTPILSVSQKDVLDLIATVRPMAMSTMTKIRVGNDYDGGYVLPALALECDAVLSIGVGPDVSFDMALAKRGAKIAQFDHTVEKPPTDHENFSFYKLGWGTESKGDLLSFDDILEKFSLLAPKRALLKFDIEGFEYDVLEVAKPDHLQNFDVIVCEFHDFNKLTELDFYKTARTCFEKITKSHAPIHMHANNYAGVSLVAGIPIPNVIEFSFLRRDLDEFPRLSSEAIPGPLDRPNHPYVVDICMNPF